MNKELKPCPFCGEKPKTEHRGNTFSIFCDAPFCSAAEFYGPDFDASSVVEAWNQRQNENLLTGMTNKYMATQSKYNKLIAELEGLEVHTFNTGLLFDPSMKEFVNHNELKTLIDKYKGGE